MIIKRLFFYVAKGGLSPRDLRPSARQKAAKRRVLKTVWKTVWKTYTLSTAATPTVGCWWISTRLRRENNQVLHNFMAKKDINLLILQLCTQLLTNDVNA